MSHKTVSVRGVPIDSGIAPLIEALWATGIVTTACCQEGATSAMPEGWPAGIAWITFEEEAHAKTFAEASGGELYNGGISVEFATSHINRLAMQYAERAGT